MNLEIRPFTWHTWQCCEVKQKSAQNLVYALLSDLTPELIQGL